MGNPAVGRGSRETLQDGKDGIARSGEMSEPRLTILAMPKPFLGHIGIIQRNAITSWTKLEPRPDIFLFGEEEGTSEIADELQVGHLHDIARNPYGTPLLDDLLRRAQEVTRTPLLCYANSDILLMQEFCEGVSAIAAQFPRFLAVAHRWNLDLQAPLDFSGDWERRFRKEILEQGTPGNHTAIDVFVFPANLYENVPPFAIGRAWFDQWLIKAACEQNVPVIDVTRVARAIHQNHDYGHIAGGQRGAYWGEEARQGLELYGGVPHAFTLLDVTHELLPGGAIRRVRYRRQRFLAREWLWRTFIQRTARMRERLGLRRQARKRLSKKDTAVKI